jgi:phosphohistidine phosphatase SixA
LRVIFVSTPFVKKKEMKKTLSLLWVLFVLAGCSHDIFVVRHAEKQVGSMVDNSADPPLTEAGEKRAIALRDRLSNEKIRSVYSTAKRRTVATAQPTADWFKLPVQTYDSISSNFFQKLKSGKKDVLVVGHSNTVFRIVNGLVGDSVAAELGDMEYDKLFIVTGHGNHYRLVTETYGK